MFKRNANYVINNLIMRKHSALNNFIFTNNVDISICLKDLVSNKC